MLQNPEPKTPAEIDPLASEILLRLHRNPAVGEIILGGGFALQHYVNFRPTHDIDAWWASAPTTDAKQAVEDAVKGTAERNGYRFRERSWGETLSYEIIHPEKNGKVFSFQISTRDIQLEPARETIWSPLLLETLTDNVASKMNALVDRGAPRDFLDIHEIVSRSICSIEECWNLWQRKNPESDVTEAKHKVLHKIFQIEARKPLEHMSDNERERAFGRREFFKNEFV